MIFNIFFSLEKDCELFQLLNTLNTIEVPMLSNMRSCPFNNTKIFSEHKKNIKNHDANENKMFKS